jgi:hypothetical protein
MREAVLDIAHTAELHLSCLIGRGDIRISKKSGKLDFSMKISYIGNLKWEKFCNWLF